MKFGMPTLIEFDTLEENVQLCCDLGLKFVEINMNFPQFQLDKLDPEHLNKLQEQYDINFTIHLAEDIDVGHLNPRIRAAYIDEIIDVLVLMEKINSKVLNMHLSKGIHITLPNQKVQIYDKYFTDYDVNIRAFRNRMDSFLTGKSQKIFVENTGIGNYIFIEKAIETLVASACFMLTWDIGHDHSSGYKDLKYLNANKHLVKHYHIHDAIDTSNHLTLYTGELDIDEFITSAINSSASMVLETKTISALKASVDELKFKGYISDKILK